MRLFVAIDVSTEVRTVLLEHQRRISSVASSGNFSHRDNLHLTLAFLGELPPSDLPRITGIVDSLDIPPFPLVIDTLGRFARSGSDIWWAGVYRNPVLLTLQSLLDSRFQEAGFTLDNRPFAAHITLARQVRMPDAHAVRELLDPIKPIRMTVGRISVMESTRIEGKLTYIELHGHDLGR
ncbi:MAG: RNA 2',3'-cyclic phosphodiesterase [Sphaerochaetaceae bacterium]|jgi:2'-5' RNA ligase|nr:RNA 2',3'-cyclic phosphodiesterase [Sphaerochaetaceae bacterium]MDX9940437.1 RNA 2',3'-cyclic phosphodiesterase [Sphaerochaetaceae bacterium]